MLFAFRGSPPTIAAGLPVWVDGLDAKHKGADMLKLYYSKGSSALAAHILLEETNAPYETQEVSIAKGEHLTSEFSILSPKRRLPLLQTPDGLLTENPAILEYIAATHPDCGLLPSGAFAQAQARSLAAYLCSTVHVAFAHNKRGARWSDDGPAIATMQAKVPDNLTAAAHYLESQFPNGTWALGDQYSFCDPYLFLLSEWMQPFELTLASFPKLAAHHAAMRARPATQKAMAAHGLF
ncbi:MAG: glutathione S-transferase family protein [Paracoccaceae bacterium]